MWNHKEKNPKQNRKRRLGSSLAPEELGSVNFLHQRDFLFEMDRREREKESLQLPEEKGHLCHANPLMLIGCSPASVTGIRPATKNLGLQATFSSVVVIVQFQASASKQTAALQGARPRPSGAPYWLETKQLHCPTGSEKQKFPQCFSFVFIG